METKIKIIVGIFAVLCLLYIIQFAVTYVNSQKKKEHYREEEEERESFQEQEGGTSYQTGLKMLEIIDEMQTKYDLTKQQKGDLASKVFMNMDDYKTKDQDTIRNEIDKLAKKISGETSTASTQPKPQTTEAPTEIITPTAPATTPSTPAAPAAPPAPADPPAVAPSIADLSSKITKIQDQLVTAQNLLEDLKKGSAPATVVKESFKVEGFENNVRFSEFF